MNQATLTPTTAETKPQPTDKLIFSYLPAYARYLKEHHLEPYVRELLAGCRELDLPLMKVLKDMPEEQLLALSLQSHGELLETIANNELRGMLEAKLKEWESDKMEIITREDIATKDITLGTFIRKRAMLKFLPLYTTDAFEIIEIVKEIDIYDAESVTASMDVYINILSDRISKQETQLLEAQELTLLGSFEWNLQNKQLDASPQLLKILELERTGDMQAFIEKVHHDDREKVVAAMKSAMNIGGSYECEYRLLCKNNTEKVIWSKGVVIFKDDKPYRFRGTVMDITEKQSLIEKLRESEKLYKQAQALSHIGSWTLDLETKEVEWSDELYNIYELPNNIPVIFADMDAYIHPDDRQRMIARRERIFATKQPEEAIYRIVLKSGKIKILLTTAELVTKDGKPHKMVGTLQDITERQEMLEELQRSDTLFKQAQAQTNIGNWTWDVTANKVSWSDEMYRIYGLEPQSVPVSFETYISHVHPEYREKRLAQVQHVFETGEPEDHIYKIVASDGKEKILHSKSEVQTDGQGKVISMTGTCQDVTERQGLIEKLQHGESLYKQAQAMSQMGSWTWDLKTDEMIWTDEMYSIYELDKGTPVTRKLATSFQHPDDRQMIHEHMETLLANGTAEKFSYRIITGKGKLKILQAVKELIKDTDGSPLRVVGSVQDVTEQKIAEKNLEDSSMFIQKIADTAPSIITSYNINTGQYSYINDGLRRLLGYEPERGLKEGVTFFASIVHPEDLERITQQNGEALELANKPENRDQNIIAEFKYRMRHANGEYLWFHTFGTIFDRNEQGMVEHVLNISIDITAQEEAEQILYQKNLQLQQSNSSLEEYAYVASHDLKEPLRKICTFGDRLFTSQEANLEDDGKLYLQKIIDSAQRMQTMINDLLSISLVSGNRNYETISLGQVMEDTLLLMEHNIEAKGAKIECSALPEATVVPSQFRQLFQNLINNSLKFTRKGTKPNIIIEHSYLQAQDVTEYELVKAKRYLKITVRDNGIGFENEFANKIFTIFQRLHGRDEYDGTGIGLAICRKVVENHGGVIFAEGKLNEGSTFTIILPTK